jgi:hypothetical protein
MGTGRVTILFLPKNYREGRYLHQGTFKKELKGCYTICMVEIVLGNTGNVAIIDDEDYDKVIAFGKWYENDSGYAIKKTRSQGNNIHIRMHSLINDTPKGMHTDHINGNRLDNRKTNLRTVTAEMNAWNRHKDRPHFVYPDLPKGVSFDKSRNQYVATRTLRKRFNTLDEAKLFASGSENET